MLVQMLFIRFDEIMRQKFMEEHITIYNREDPGTPLPSRPAPCKPRTPWQAHRTTHTHTHANTLLPLLKESTTHSLVKCV